MKKFARSLGAISVAVAFGAGSAALAPAAGAQSLPTGSLGSSAASECGEQVVTPSTLKGAGWGTPDDETPAKITANTVANDEVGAGALTFPIEETPRGTSLYKNANKIKLADLLKDKDGKIVPISYNYFTGGQAPALQIRLLDANVLKGEDKSNNGFATIVWSPEPAANQWTEATPGDSDQFWVTRTLVDANGATVLAKGAKTTLKDIIAKNPKAIVSEYGVQQTKGNLDKKTAVDNFQLGCTTTNFELEPAGSLENIFGSVTDIFSS